MQGPSKNLKYNQDGSGRDTYISYDNGGYYTPSKNLIVLKDPGNFLRCPPLKNTVSTFMDRPKKYYNNGTGRDSYIYYNDGGYCPGYTKTNFLRILRSDRSFGSPSQKRARALSSKDVLASIIQKKSQKDLSNRLSQPEQKSTNNPQKYGSSNYQVRQTTKWLSNLGHRPSKSVMLSKPRHQSSRILRQHI